MHGLPGAHLKLYVFLDGLLQRINSRSGKQLDSTKGKMANKVLVIGWFSKSCGGGVYFLPEICQMIAGIVNSHPEDPSPARIGKTTQPRGGKFKRSRGGASGFKSCAQIGNDFRVHVAKETQGQVKLFGSGPADFFAGEGSLQGLR